MKDKFERFTNKFSKSQKGNAEELCGLAFCLKSREIFIISNALIQNCVQLESTTRIHERIENENEKRPD